MRGYLARRLLISAFTVFVVVTVVFILIRLAPGDPARNILGSEATAEAIAVTREKWGLNESILVQYVAYLRNILAGDFGDSFLYGQPAAQVLVDRLPNTLALAFAATILTVVIAVPLGTLMARRPRSRFDRIASAVTIVGQSMPDFWVAILLILLFAVQLHLLPTSGFAGPTSIILPAATIAILSTALLARVTRRELIHVNESPFIRVAMAHGMSPFRILARHALPNASIPIVTLIGTMFAGMLNGVVVVEYVYSWPGVGFTAVRALTARDYPLLQATVISTSVLAILVLLVVDIWYLYLDPRIRLGGASE